MIKNIKYTGFGLAVVSLLFPAYKVPFLGSVSLIQNWQGWLLLVVIRCGIVAATLGKQLWTRIRLRGIAETSV